MKQRTFEDTVEDCRERALDCLSFLHHIAAGELKADIETIYPVIEKMGEDVNGWRWRPSACKVYNENLGLIVDFKYDRTLPGYAWTNIHCRLQLFTRWSDYFSDAAYEEYAGMREFPLAERLELREHPGATSGACVEFGTDQAIDDAMLVDADSLTAGNSLSINHNALGKPMELIQDPVYVVKLTDDPHPVAEYCPICDGVGFHSATCFRRKS